MDNSRQCIIDAVRECLGTPFGHQGRTPGKLLDCVGLVRVPFVVCAGREDDFTNYGVEPRPAQMCGLLRRYFVEKPKTLLLPGDVLWLKVLDDPQHLAVYTGHTVIHAVGGREVVEHGYRHPWPKRLVAVFEYPWLSEGA